MKVDVINKNGIDIYHITAELGHVFQRISDGKIFSNEIELGDIYYLFKDNKPVKLSAPIKELPEHYVEIIEVVEPYTED